MLVTWSQKGRNIAKATSILVQQGSTTSRDDCRYSGYNWSQMQTLSTARHSTASSTATQYVCVCGHTH
jgi:hypothetical protein